MKPPVELRSCPAPAKLNLYLHVLGRRDNGYHDIETVFDLVDLHDTLHFSVRSDGAIMRRGGIHGLAYDSDLSVRAARLLASATETRLGTDIEVIKRIPVGGGLGGGSSNAATTLLALNRLWDINWPLARLARLGLQLGADVPIFIHGNAAFATGVGEKLTTLELPEQWYVVVAPPASVPTAEIFAAPELTRDSKPLRISPLSRGQIGAVGTNDLETVACNRYPQVQKALDALTRLSKLSGTGGPRPASPTKKVCQATKSVKIKKTGKIAGSESRARSTRGITGDTGEFTAWPAARMSGSGACVFLPVADQQAANRIAERLAEADVGKSYVVRSISQHPLKNWAFGRR